MKERLREIVERTDSPAGYAFDLGVQCLIVASMLAFAIETLPNLSESTYRLLTVFETASLCLFVLEYLLRLWVSEHPLRYARSFFGIVDLIAIAPAIAFAGANTTALRSLRLLRLVRLFKLARYNSAVKRLHLALVLAWEELVLFSAVSAVLLFIAAAGIYQFENAAQPETFASIFHSLWWAVATLTTVGYGDVYPVTAGGKAFTFLVLLIGLGVIATPAGMIASALTRARELESENQAQKPGA